VDARDPTNTIPDAISQPHDAMRSGFSDRGAKDDPRNPLAKPPKPRMWQRKREQEQKVNF
jgi:hypothetical protein